MMLVRFWFRCHFVIFWQGYSRLLFGGEAGHTHGGGVGGGAGALAG
jgi:hypothetical protein